MKVIFLKKLEQINKIDNSVKDIGSIKMIKGFDFQKDKNKLCNLWYNLPDNGNSLSQYISNNLKLTSKEMLNVTSAKIVGTDLRTGTVFKELPSQFKNRIKLESQYDNSNFKKVNLELIGLTKKDIAESAYESLKNKF